MKSTSLSLLTSLGDEFFYKVYAGVLGKVIGVRHGADIEGWTYEQIQERYGEINSYIRDYKKNFAADDDTNGPIFFIRALEDYSNLKYLTSKEMGLTWLNYVPDGHGFFWWGGYGNATEHTAYENLKNGIEAPKSGSALQNGVGLSEQIGGQIFSDIWGLVHPGNPRKAADLARNMSAVSHDGEGIYGGMFMAACTAAAFDKQNITDIIHQGLSVIPLESEYSRVVRQIISYYQEYPDDWRACFQYIRKNHGYNHYPGPVHIIPNAAIVVISLLYGEGDFSKSINIANMCGWDTDCNVGNVGTIIGVRNGLEGIELFWRDPVHDFLVCSSVMGSLNMVDLPNFSIYVALLCYKVNGILFPEKWKSLFFEENVKYHFELPGSTHSIQTASDLGSTAVVVINTDETSLIGDRSLKLVWKQKYKNCGYRAFFYTYYTPDDFDDSRMDPAFSPILYPGQTIKATIYVPISRGTGFRARLYAFDRNKGIYYYGDETLIFSEEWISLGLKVPILDSVCLKQAGVELIPLNAGTEEELTFFIDSFSISGPAHYSLSFENEKVEMWNNMHQEISQITSLRGIWSLENGHLFGRFNGPSAECYTGNRYWKDYKFSVVLIPKQGDDHLILFRVQGGIKCYAFGLAPNGTVVFYKKDEEGFHRLQSIYFPWRMEEPIELTVEASGNKFQFYLNNKWVFESSDNEMSYISGAIGFGNMNQSLTAFKNFKYKGMN